LASASAVKASSDNNITALIDGEKAQMDMYQVKVPTYRLIDLVDLHRNTT
jgi:hypothetical protein